MGGDAPSSSRAPAAKFSLQNHYIQVLECFHNTRSILRLETSEHTRSTALCIGGRRNRRNASHQTDLETINQISRADPPPGQQPAILRGFRPHQKGPSSAPGAKRPHSRSIKRFRCIISAQFGIEVHEKQPMLYLGKANLAHRVDPVVCQLQVLTRQVSVFCDTSPCCFRSGHLSLP